MQIDDITPDGKVTDNPTFISDGCTTSAACQDEDNNKECVMGNCVCMTGYHPSATGLCVQGKITRY